MSYRPTIGGRLRKETSGVDRSQAGCCWWGSDPVKEIGQTCGSNVIVRRMATSNRSMVTAAKLVYSTWKFTQPGEKNGKAIYRNRLAPQPVHVLHSVRERADVFDGVGVGRAGEVRQEATANRRGGGGNHGQYPIIFRCSGGACGARGGGEHESISCDSPIGKEDGSQRCAHAGVVLIEEHVAGGAYEG